MPFFLFIIFPTTGVEALLASLSCHVYYDNVSV